MALAARIEELETLLHGTAHTIGASTDVIIPETRRKFETPVSTRVDSVSTSLESRLSLDAKLSLTKCEGLLSDPTCVGPMELPTPSQRVALAATSEDMLAIASQLETIAQLSSVVLDSPSIAGSMLVPGRLVGVFPSGSCYLQRFQACCRNCGLLSGETRSYGQKWLSYSLKSKPYWTHKRL